MRRCTDIWWRYLSIAWTLLSVVCISILMVSEANAAGYNVSCGSLSTYDLDLDAKNNDSTAVVAQKKELQQIINRANSYCEQLAKTYPDIKKSWLDTPASYSERFNKILEANPEIKSEYGKLETDFKQKYRDIMSSDGVIPCGENHPFGCDAGEKCYYKQTNVAGDSIAAGTSATFTEYDCRKSGGLTWKEAPLGSQGKGSSVETNVAGATSEVWSDEEGNTHVKKLSYNNENKKTPLTNESCQIDKMKEKYQSKCYSCLVVKTLLEKFLNASTKAYELCRDAGVQVLLIGSMIWIAFFVLKNLASFTNIEPASMVNSLLVQFFKIMVAYVVIMSGADTFIWYVVNPLIAAGTDYGIGVLDASAGILNTQLSEEYTYKGVSSVSADILNNVLALTQGVDHVVSENLVIGHALTCHSTHAGAWVNETILNFRIIIPNIWIFICGLLIWFAGFMLVLGVCFYLLDITFKLGLAIMIFPVVMGLWPFSLTANKLSICIATILRSAAIFAFLAITTSFAMALISVSLRDVPELYERIAAGDAKWVSDTFDITGPYFIILVFAYLYSIKLVGETISSFVDKFFSGGIAAGASPMHSEMTRMTDISKKTALGVGAYGVAAAKYQGGRLLGGAAGMTIGKAAKFVKKQFNKPDEDKDSQRENATTQAGQATQAAGRATQAAGQATQTAGQATAATGRATAAAGRATSAGGRGVMRAGAALSKTGIGAIIGVPMMIAGAAMSAGGKAVEYTGKAVQKGGQAMQKAGKAMKKVGKRVEDAGKKMEKFGRKLDRGNEAEPKEDNNTNASNEDGNEAQK